MAGLSIGPTSLAGVKGHDPHEVRRDRCRVGPEDACRGRAPGTPGRAARGSWFWLSRMLRGAGEEDRLLHEFALLLQEVREPSEIHSELVACAGKLALAERVELLQDQGPGRPVRLLARWGAHDRELLPSMVQGRAPPNGSRPVGLRSTAELSAGSSARERSLPCEIKTRARCRCFRFRCGLAADSWGRCASGSTRAGAALGGRE